MGNIERAEMDGQPEFLARAVRDTLDSVVSAAVRDSLLSEALMLAGEPEIPRDIESFLAFMETGLRRVLARALGRELGRSVIVELERLIEPIGAPKALFPAGGEPSPARSGRPRSTETRKVASVDSSIASRATPPHQRDTLPAGRASSEAPVTPRARRSPSETERARMAPTRPPLVRPSQPRPPASADYPSGMARALGMTQSSSPPGTPEAKAQRLPFVFLATRDAELVRRFRAWLDPRASVVRVSRLIDLLLELKDAGHRKAVVVLDGAMPAIRIEAIAALTDEFPESLRIVLWGGARELDPRLASSFPRVAEWIVWSENAPLSDLVDCCVEIVG